MDRNRVNSLNCSQSRFLKSFSPSMTDQYSPKGNGEPVLKRPKLDLSNKPSYDSSSYVPKEKDLYDDLWGDDPDSTALEKVCFDETFALSQAPEIMKTDSHSSVDISEPKYGRLNKLPQAIVTKGNNSRPGFVKNKTMPSNHMKNSPKAPLRRTASHGWPAENSFNHSQYSNRQNLITKTNVGGRPNNINCEQMKIENKNLEEQLKNLKEQLTRKAGEANLLRDKLTSVQQEYSKQKQEYNDEIETYKQEAEALIGRISKENKSLKSQLDVKLMEEETAEMKTQPIYSFHRSGHSDSPNNRFRNNIISKFSPARHSNKTLQKEDQLMNGRSQIRAKTFSFSFQLLQQTIIPELLIPTQPEASVIESTPTITNSGLFSGSVGIRQAPDTINKNSLNSFFHTERSEMTEVLPSVVNKQLSGSCPSLQPCSLSLLSSRLVDINIDTAHQVIPQVLETCLQILESLHHQLNSTVCPQNRYMEREREVLHCGYKYLTLTEGYNLLCSKELYNNERGISARRALALLSTLVEISDFAAVQILPSSSSDQQRDENPITIPESVSVMKSHTILHIVKGIVCQIEKQRRTLMFEGVLAGATSLIKSLVQKDFTLSQPSQELIVQILQGVVFARPGSLVIHNILQFMLAATKYPKIMDSICHNSVKKTFLENTRHSIITYTPDTCILQVMCMLLQLVETPKKHILSDVFTSWILTLFYYGQPSPKWLFSVPSQRFCQCRPLISKLAFTLLGEACCIYPTAANNEKKLLEKLLTRGILLVCTLLYHDEHFGVNVDRESIGSFEIFLHSMKMLDLDVKLDRACSDTLENLCTQEALRQPANLSDGQSFEHNSLLGSLYSSDKSCDVLKYLDTC